MKTKNNHITNTVVTDWGGDHLLSVGEIRINKRGFYASEEFLEMFQFPLTQGNTAKALDEPGSIVISESAAKALFGDQAPINQIIRSLETLRNPRLGKKK